MKNNFPASRESKGPTNSADRKDSRGPIHLVSNNNHSSLEEYNINLEDQDWKKFDFVSNDSSTFTSSSATKTTTTMATNSTASSRREMKLGQENEEYIMDQQLTVHAHQSVDREHIEENPQTRNPNNNLNRTEKTNQSVQRNIDTRNNFGTEQYTNQITKPNASQNANLITTQSKIQSTDQNVNNNSPQFDSDNETEERNWKKEWENDWKNTPSSGWYTSDSKETKETKDAKDAKESKREVLNHTATGLDRTNPIEKSKSKMGSKLLRSNETHDTNSMDSNVSNVLKTQKDHPQLVSLSKSKYDQLISQFQRIKSQLATERSNSKEYKQKVKELEDTTLKLKERNELLEYNNKRLEKRCAHLQDTLNEKDNDTLLSRLKSTAVSSNWKSDMKIMEEELLLKIQENESLHSQVFELKQEHSATINRMELDIENLMSDLKQKNILITELKEKVAKKRMNLEQETQAHKESVATLQDQLYKCRLENLSMQKKLSNISQEQEEMNRKLTLLIPFNDIFNHDWNMLNCPPHNRLLIQKSLQFHHYSKGFLLQLGKLLTGLWATVYQKITIISNVSDTHSPFTNVLSSGSTSSNSYSPIVHFIHDQMQNNHEKIDIENQKFCSELSSQFDHIINKMQTFLDYRQLTSDSLVKYRSDFEKLMSTFVQYITFLNRAMLYLVISLQDSKCSSKNQYGPNYLKFDFVYIDSTTTLTKNYQKFVQHMKVFMDYCSEFIPTKPTNNTNTAAENDIPTPSKRKQRTKSVFVLPKRQSKKLIIPSKDADQSAPTAKSSPHSGMKQSNSMSNILELDKPVIIDDYITDDGTNPSESEDDPTKHIYVYLQRFCNFMKDFQESIETAIKVEHTLDFISTSIKSSNEKIVYIFSNVVILLNRFQANLNEYQQVIMENTPNYVHGAEVDTIYWNPLIYGIGKESKISTIPLTTISNSTLASVTGTKKYVKHAPYDAMATESRSYMNILETQFHEDSRSFNNISHATALENRREIEHLNSEKQHFENLTKKYKSSIQQMIQHIQEVVSEIVPNHMESTSPLTNSLTDQEQTFEACLKSLVDVIADLEHHRELNQESDGKEKEISQEILDRETKMVKEYEKIIKHLEKQVKICDAKAVDYRIDWQKAVAQLEEAYGREKNLTFKISETNQLLQKIQDELHTTRENYEKQIQLLTNSLIQLQGEKKTAASGFSFESLWSKR